MAPVYAVGGIVIAAGCLIAAIAVISAQGRLPRNGIAGVRTPATMRSDAAFAVANKTSAPYAAAGGAVMIVGAAIGMVVPKHVFGVPLFTGIAIGMALILAGATVGVRACKGPEFDA